MGFQCDKEVYAKKPPWQGLARFQIVYIRKKFRLAKNISLPSTANGSGTEDTQHQDEQDSTVEDEVT